MTPFKFYFWFAIFVESFPLFPIFVGIKKWYRLPLGIKFFLGFLISDLLLNLIGDYYYYTKTNNLFLYYFYSFFQSLFLLLGFYCFFENRLQKSVTVLLLAFSICLLLADFLFFSKIDYNYLSGFWIDLFIFSVSVYFFSKEIISIQKERQLFYEVKVTLSLIISLQFFVKMIAIYLEKYLLETQNNAFLWLQAKDIYYFFMLLSLIAYSYALYNLKADDTH